MLPLRHSRRLCLGCHVWRFGRKGHVIQIQIRFRFRFRLILFCQHTTFSNSNVYKKNEIIKYADMEAPIKGALYRIQILCRRYTFWSYPAGLTIADPRDNKS